MNKRFFTGCVVIAMLLSATQAVAQETNAGDDYSAYLPEVRAFNQQLAQMPKGGSVLTKAGLTAARGSLDAGDLTRLHPQPVLMKIQGPGGTIGLRMFRPDTIDAVVLDIHGGGWSLGSAATDDDANAALATTCKVAVVSVDYRLAPENKFPTCIDDCKAAAKWLFANAKKEFGTDKVFLSGGSAGAHLAALTALYIRDSLHAIDKVLGVNLLYGCYDLSRTPSNRMATDSTLMISKQYLDQTWQLVFHELSPEQLRNKKYSPLYADLRNLPPALFTVGTADPLLDDTYFMEARWRSAGNKTFLAVYPEGVHGFNLFPSQMAKVANDRVFEWMKGLMGK